MRLHEVFLVTAVILLYNSQLSFGNNSEKHPVRDKKTANRRDSEEYGEDDYMRCEHNSDVSPGLICCAGWLTRKSYDENTACCGSVAFNNKTHFCCQELRVLKREYGYFTSCCRYSYLTVVYDTRVQACCYGAPIPQGEICTRCRRFISAASSSSHMCCRGQPVYQRYGNHSKCCGYQAYDARSQTCCAGMISRQNYGNHSKCCGYQAYDARSQTCCAGVISHQNYGVSTTCCRATPYDSRQSLCCASQFLVPKTYGNDSACCGYLGVYNVKKQICCGGLKLYSKKYGEFTGCCRYSYLTSVYDGRHQKCCFGKAIQKSQACRRFGL